MLAFELSLALLDGVVLVASLPFAFALPDGVVVVSSTDLSLPLAFAFPVVVESVSLALPPPLVELEPPVDAPPDVDPPVVAPPVVVPLVVVPLVVPPPLVVLVVPVVVPDVPVVCARRPGNASTARAAKIRICRDLNIGEVEGTPALLQCSCQARNRA